MKKTAAALLAVSIGLSGSLAHADSTLDLSLPAYSSSPSYGLLASNDNGSPRSKKTSAQPDKPLHVDFKEPTFTGEKMHQYLGLATLGFVALTAISPKAEGGPHEAFGTAAAATAVATVGTGLVYHWDDFHFEDGVGEPDNIHMLLGTVGALLMAAAVSQAPESTHPGLGIGGSVLMATAVKITW